MRTDFKVYPRKIQVYYKRPVDLHYSYAWSTNAYKTCRDAVAEASRLHPKMQFKANFEKV